MGNAAGEAVDEQVVTWWWPKNPATIEMIYTISEGRIGPTKIGVTRNDRERGRALQTGNPRELRFGVGLCCCHARDIERRVHERLREHRMVGEWFNITPDEASAAIDAVIAERCG